MKMRNKNLLRTISMGMAVVLLLAGIPCTALAAGFSAIVTSDSMPVIANVDGKKVSASLPKNTIVTVTDYDGSLARIKYRGYTAYASVSDMATVESVSKQAVVTTNTYAYKKASLKSDRTKVKAGTMVNVLAVKGSAAMVEKNGAVAYMYVNHLLIEGQPAPDIKEDSGSEREQQPSGTKVPSFVDAYQSGKYSNEQLCYLFLTQVMGYNNAAAAGVLSNMYYESSFKTAINGDGGTSYGLCQWHAARKTMLINYCDSYGVSASSLVGQLAFLKYELENYYPSVHKYLKSVSNTAQGAYDAGYHFCYNYEVPASKASQSAKRASTAQNTYYTRYASI